MAENPKKMKKNDEDEVAQISLEEANTIQIDLEALTKRMMTKLLSVIQEFNMHKRPLYNKRHTALQKVPHFWAIAFMNHPKLKLLVDNSVEDCFNYLIHIQVIDNEDVKSGYQIVFTFDVNPYFYNCELIKHHVYENGEVSTLKTSVEWKENMNITSERKMKGKKRSAPVENFFDWIQRSSNNKTDILCDIIRDDLWADPLKYFFLPDDGREENSESESDEDEELEEVIESEDDTNDEELGEHDEIGKQNSD